jgi:hypothetical protein
MYRKADFSIHVSPEMYRKRLIEAIFRYSRTYGVSPAWGWESSLAACLLA